MAFSRIWDQWTASLRRYLYFFCSWGIRWPVHRGRACCRASDRQDWCIQYSYWPKFSARWGSSALSPFFLSSWGPPPTPGYFCPAVKGETSFLPLFVRRRGRTIRKYPWSPEACRGVQLLSIARTRITVSWCEDRRLCCYRNRSSLGQKRLWLLEETCLHLPSWTICIRSIRPGVLLLGILVYFTSRKIGQVLVQRYRSTLVLYFLFALLSNLHGAIALGPPTSDRRKVLYSISIGNGLFSKCLESIWEMSTREMFMERPPCRQR